MPTVDKNKIIGVRTPELRKYTKEIRATTAAEEFLHSLPHKYYEEDNLHAFLLEYIGDFNLCIASLDRFLPYVDNWATCDGMNPKILTKYPDKLLEKTEDWLCSPHTYTVRYGIGVLMRYFLEEGFDLHLAQRVANVKSEEYYVNMMRAWYFATALAKQYDAALPWLEECRLDPWTHNKTIQKAVESYRVSPEQKEYLRTLRRK
jgi:3-methyladenine DNA glycosylase AlkD